MPTNNTIPYPVNVSLEPLLTSLQDGSKASRSFLGPVIKTLSEASNDPSLMDKKTWEALASLMFSPLPGPEAYRGIFKPFVMEPLYMTPALQAVFHWKQANHSSASTHSDRHESLRHLGTSMIFEALYGPDHRAETPSPVFWFEDPQGFRHATQMEIDIRFCRVVVDRPEEFQVPGYKEKVLEAFQNSDQLRELLPPSRFTFEGLFIMTATDITPQALLGELQYHLIEKASLIHGGYYDDIQKILQNFLGKNTIHMKLMVYRGSELFMVNSHAKGATTCMYQEEENAAETVFTSSWFQDVIQERKPFLSLKSSTDPVSVQHWSQAPKGISSFLAVPLVDQDKVMGCAVLSSWEGEELSLRDYYILAKVWPLLSMATRRALEEFEHEVEAVIRSEYTAIHPSVEWKFRQVASQVIFGRQKGIEGIPLSIEFDEVYPLYALSDVRNSSILRASAIIQDLSHQLTLASEVLGAAWKQKPLPILEEIQYRLEQQKTLLSDGLNTGDETSVVQFLKMEMEPLMEELASYGGESLEAVQRYRQALDPAMKSVYLRRGELDSSIRSVNDHIGNILEEAQKDAQAMYPHYFDKTSTDGVDQNIYIGPGMALGRPWKKLYLQNLRLWQFIVLARTAQKLLEIKDQLPVPLDMTHLIMVQDLPLSIYFRLDEKRFAVEGAYNIRYELIKKRIDKATIKGTGQRLTQPGQIAIVYSRGEEGREYKRYLEFLRNRGYLEAQVEELELEDLQGVHGLKAFRVKVNPLQPALNQSIWEEVETAKL